MWVIHWIYALLFVLHNSTFTEILEFMCSDDNRNTCFVDMQTKIYIYIFWLQCNKFRRIFASKQSL